VEDFSIKLLLYIRNTFIYFTVMQSVVPELFIQYIVIVGHKIIISTQWVLHIKF